MNVEIKPDDTGGEIRIPPSKSVSHRAILAAALAEGTSYISKVLLSQDIVATIEAAKDFGADIVAEQDDDGLYTLIIDGEPNPRTSNCLIECGESASTVRFIIPIIALDAENTVINGEGRLTKRPLEPYIKIFEQQGFTYQKNEDELPLILDGQLQPGKFELPGDVSSQFLTGLFFALPLLDKDSEIVLTSRLESKPYVDLTIEVLKKFGIKIERPTHDSFIIPGNQNYKATKLEIPGDFSQAAFWFVNGTINRETILKDLPKESAQGDFQMIELINEIGGNISYNEAEKAWVSKPSSVKSFNIDVADIPDLVPILAIIAGLAEGTSTLYGTKRLRFKESDRVESTTSMLKSFGVEVEQDNDSITINGQDSFSGGIIDSFSDHRIAIASAIASGRAKENVIITDAQCVRKSYPNFWDDFEDAGGIVDAIDVG